ncbi:MAG TPA: class I SAM-dependent methyltransferase [Pseudonocardiaceae bacterium]
MSVSGLNPVAATLYTPLYARAHAAELVPEAGLRDPLAASLLDSAGPSAPGLLRDRNNVAGAIWRAVIFDELTRQFSAEHPHGLVVSAGIGLCTRRQRLAGTVPDSLGWAGVDQPEVIALRREMLPEDDTVLMGGSLGKPGWAEDLRDAGRPVLVLAEGVIMYLTPEELAAFLTTARTVFGPGTQLVADYFHPMSMLSRRHPIARATGARFRSGARNGRALAKLSPGWRLAGEYDVMERISAVHRAAALILRGVLFGGRPYAVAHLVGV